MGKAYTASEAMLERALEVIPLGSQTFSKSMVQYPVGAAPLFITRGKGSRVTDIDGNEYVDFVSGLLAISLGYADPDVDDAVREQLTNGVTFSLPHPLEIEVAEKLIRHIPCAEAVRFGKNGSDATSAAIRLARAYTGREHIAACGYHGWHDWYIGSTSRDLGVPRATKSLTLRFEYNDLDSLEQLLAAHPQQIAAVIMEPMNLVYPRDNFLERIKTLTREHGALLIFDETVTGFRFALGGAQQLLAVTPDLATFGKGMANGYPLSAIVGRKDVMKLMNDIFFSGTFGGETLSLAAANAVIDKLERHDVIENIRSKGEILQHELEQLIDCHNLGHIFAVSGHPSWSFLTIRDTGDYTNQEIKTLLLQELFERGILMIGSHNLSYAHSDDDIKMLLSAYEEVFPMLLEAVNQATLLEQLRCKTLEPVFKVR